MCETSYRIYCKGLVSEEVVKDETRQIGGFGVAICDPEDNRLYEMRKALGDEESTQQEVAELAALVHGLKWALELDLARVTFFCDDSNILEYVTGKAEPNESSVATLVKEVALLQSRFSSCEALPASVSSGSITFVLEHARAAIASQIRWREGDVYMETCPICCEDVPCDDKFEVPGCFHRFCVACIKRQVDEALDWHKPVKCPSLGCNSVLQSEDCEGVLDPVRLRHMAEYLSESALLDHMTRQEERRIKKQETTGCTWPPVECTVTMEKTKLIEYSKTFFADAELLGGARKCMGCGYCFCANCRTEWHYNMTCDVFRETETYKSSPAGCYEAMAKSLGWRRCRNCKSMLASDGDRGCNRITCSSKRR
ncbi:PREDICTED: uncharacterized protein LOC104737878 [Camelina sativa]|uniref:RBR-type E3 ubiquitin transferase n=1 Tax=Camelina sativa TaxID=90675 RepID=A0ABM1QTA8_CAMSA|nr:PREDICTED: uncharacterized protein LOC104737878 [Camelina sativa]